MYGGTRGLLSLYKALHGTIVSKSVWPVHALHGLRSGDLQSAV